MKKALRTRRSRRSGAILAGTVSLMLIIAILTAGIGRFAASHQQRCTVDSDYAAALDLAEAGINYEFRKISSDYSQADNTPATVSLGRGTFTVSCTNRQGGGAWVPPNDLYVSSTGTVRGVSRTVRASGKGNIGSNRYAIYGVNLVHFNGGLTVNGSVGTDGTIDKSNNSTITGIAELDGPSATLIGPSPNVVHNPNKVYWKTVSQMALTFFPNSGATAPGGLAYLQTHNNNASVGLPADGSLASITSSITLVGPGDYYVSSIILNGSNQIRFNNTNGPIRLWVGPEGGAGLVKLTGTTDATVTAANEVDVYVATLAGVDLVGNTTMNANIYCYNRNSVTGIEYGSVTNSGTPQVNGSVLGYNVDLNGNASVVFTQSIDPVGAYSYYGFDNTWTEINPR